MNYQRLYGKKPTQKVMMYKGMEPYVEMLFNAKFNQAGSRYTNEDFKLLGETMYKGFSGLTSAKWKLLDDVKQSQAVQAGRFQHNIGRRLGLSYQDDYDEDDVDEEIIRFGRDPNQSFNSEDLPSGTNLSGLRALSGMGYGFTPEKFERQQQMNQVPLDVVDLFKIPQLGLPEAFKKPEVPQAKPEDAPANNAGGDAPDGGGDNGGDAAAGGDGGGE